jgi:hypothetical protein
MIILQTVGILGRVISSSQGLANKSTIAKCRNFVLHENSDTWQQVTSVGNVIPWELKLIMLRFRRFRSAGTGGKLVMNRGLSVFMSLFEYIQQSLLPISVLTHNFHSRVSKCLPCEDTLLQITFRIRVWSLCTECLQVVQIKHFQGEL